MKKVYAIAVSLSVAGLVAGCAGTSGSSTSITSTTPATHAAQGPQGDQPLASARAQEQATEQQALSLPAEAVKIVKETGAQTTAVYGDRDVYGDGNASGQFGSDGEQITVYTFSDQAAMDNVAQLDNGWAPTDSTQWVTGPLFVVEVTGANVFDSSGQLVTQYSPSVAVVAQRVGGVKVS